MPHATAAELVAMVQPLFDEAWTRTGEGRQPERLRVVGAADGRVLVEILPNLGVRGWNDPGSLFPHDEARREVRKALRSVSESVGTAWAVDLKWTGGVPSGAWSHAGPWDKDSLLALLGGGRTPESILYDGETSDLIEGMLDAGEIVQDHFDRTLDGSMRNLAPYFFLPGDPCAD